MKISASDIASYKYCSVKWAFSKRIKVPDIRSIEKKLRKLKALQTTTPEQWQQIREYEAILRSQGRIAFGERAHRSFSARLKLRPFILIAILGVILLCMAYLMLMR